MDLSIEADGVALRLWAPDDADAIAEIVRISRTELDLWLPGLTSTLSDQTTFVEHVAQRAHAESAWHYGVVVDTEVVGQCSVEDRGFGTAELGYWVRSDHAGRGIAGRTVRAVCDAAFRHGFELLVIRCDEANQRSAAVARRAGFTHASTVPLDVPAETTRTGREMTWHRRRP